MTAPFPRNVVILAALAGVTLAAKGCVTGSDATPAADGGSAPSATGPAPQLGPLAMGDVKRTIYESLEAALARGHGGDTAAGAAEIGDYDAFKFTIVKLTAGKDDVSGDPEARPDGMDVEVVGWYKRPLAQAEGGRDAECLGFDARVVVVRQGDSWAVPGEQAPSFGREYAEDCY